MKFHYEDEDEVCYYYWGERCLALAERISRPKPTERGRLWVWLSKRSGTEHIMLVTAIGVTLGVTLGVLLGLGTLVVSVFQTKREG